MEVLELIIGRSLGNFVSENTTSWLLTAVLPIHGRILTQKIFGEMIVE